MTYRIGGFLIFFIILFVICFILKKQIEEFTTIVVTGQIDKKNSSISDKALRFRKLCIGDTCIEGDELTAIQDLIHSKSKGDSRIHPFLNMMCIDNVCLTSSHLSAFNPTERDRSEPLIYNTTSQNDISKIKPFTEKGKRDDAYIDRNYKVGFTRGFRLVLIDDTKTILDGFNRSLWTDERTQMMSGRIAYAPNQTYKAKIYKLNRGFDDFDRYPSQEKSCQSLFYLGEKDGGLDKCKQTCLSKEDCDGFSYVKSDGKCWGKSYENTCRLNWNSKYDWYQKDVKIPKLNRTIEIEDYARSEDQHQAPEDIKFWFGKPYDVFDEITISDKQDSNPNRLYKTTSNTSNISNTSLYKTIVGK